MSADLLLEPISPPRKIEPRFVSAIITDGYITQHVVSSWLLRKKHILLAALECVLFTLPREVASGKSDLAYPPIKYSLRPNAVVDFMLFSL